MNTKTRSTIAACLGALCVGNPSLTFADDQGLETDRDLAGDVTKYFGQRRNQYRDITRKLAKTDLDGDFNYDGVIDNDDPADNGAFQQTPPGLVVGVGELSQLILRITPYRLDFRGQAVVSLQVDGINRADKSGLYNSQDEEIANMGHVKVWRDASRSELLIDSRDPARRVYEWNFDDDKYPANVPGIIPRSVYVEGISPSGPYTGDVRLLLKVQHRQAGANVMPTDPGAKGVMVENTDGKSERVYFKRFSTSYDHILLTIHQSPQTKEFVIKETGVWISPSTRLSEK